MRLGALLRRAAPYRGRLLLASGLSVAGSAALLVAPWLAGQALSGLVGWGDPGWDRGGATLALIGMLAGALVASTGFSVAAAIVGARTAGRILADLRLLAYRHVLRLPLAFHDRSRQGDLLALLTYEVAQLSQFLSTTLAGLPAMAFTAAGSLVLLFWLDPRVALAAPILVPLFFVVLKLVGRRQRRLAAAAREAEAAVICAAEEDLALLPAIRAFAVEEERACAYAALAETAQASVYAQQRLSALVGPMIALVAALAVIALLVLGAGRGEGRAAAGAGGEVFSLLLYAALLTRPVAALADFYGQLQWARGTLSRLEAVLAEPVEPGAQPSGAAPGPEAGPRQGKGQGEGRGVSLVFDRVHFSYPGRPEVLRGLELEVAPGQIVALTGLNGAGKSTLLHLLLRFYEPQAGKILFDGADIAGIEAAMLRRRIGLVPQAPLLGAGSIAQNIALGRPQASGAQIIAAAKVAQAHDFITGLPHGYATNIGDHGTRLSGGQRQRIALARALLADPELLVFDEATAMFDLPGEAAFLEACRIALAGRTVLLVTHRPAALALAQRIVRIEGGRALET